MFVYPQNWYVEILTPDACEAMRSAVKVSGKGPVEPLPLHRGRAQRGGASQNPGGRGRVLTQYGHTGHPGALVLGLLPPGP